MASEPEVHRPDMFAVAWQGEASRRAAAGPTLAHLAQLRWPETKGNTYDTAWWFGTCVIFPYWESHHPI